jgi:ADP-ribose pyrophosphatase YjhB (NUDIX family)
MSDVARSAIYDHCPRCGRRAMSSKRPGLVVCAECGLALFVGPSPAVGAIVLDREDRVLLIRRAHEPGKGLLAVPGGFVDQDETAEHALRREIREEVGLELHEFVFLISEPNHYPYKGIVYTTLDLFFVARVSTFDAAKPLDAVAELVIRRVSEVSPDELAFESMKVAWRAFVSQR